MSYRDLVTSFAAITAILRASNGRCCARADGGVPECCQQIIDGADLTFTRTEVDLLGLPMAMVLLRQDGMLILNREYWTPAQIQTSLQHGVLSRTLESASHPTRPFIRDGQVTDVIVIDACNGDIGFDRYVDRRHELMALWAIAVEMVGPKPYYCSGEPRSGWRRLCQDEPMTEPSEAPDTEQPTESEQVPETQQPTDPNEPPVQGDGTQYGTNPAAG